MKQAKKSPNRAAEKPIIEVTGHQWDGIQEYTNPDPFVLRILFYIIVFFLLGYWFLYPSWPTPNTPGWLNWSSYKELDETQEEIKKRRAVYQVDFDKATFDQILKDPVLLKFAITGGKSAFENNCAPCHGAGGGGAPGYPNLTAGSWLWGGKIEDIYTTLMYGIRSGHDETRDSQMAAFGKDKILTPQQVELLTTYVMSLNKGGGDPSDPTYPLFQSECASCHGPSGSGGREFGAPNLRDAIWLYGDGHDTIYDVIYSGRQGIMPYWNGKLSDSTIRQLAIYVHQLGGGE